MDSRIKLKVLGISYNQIQNGAYALILAQADGPVRIPVVIGAAEAQSIALHLEGVKPPRPLTHDLFTSFAHAFGVKLKEVFIAKFEDGVFWSELTFSDGSRDVVLDSRTSDAIAIALRTKAPIYTTAELLHDTGFVMEIQDRDGNPVEPIPDDGSELPYDSRPPRYENYAVEELERTLKGLIENEDYEQAAIVSEILKRKRNQ